jgi:EamA domain-containing membrane protein RarD
MTAGKDNILLRSLVQTIAATLTFFLANYIQRNKITWQSYASFVLVFGAFSVIGSAWRHRKDKKAAARRS